MKTRETQIQKLISSPSTGKELCNEIEGCLEEAIEPLDQMSEYRFEEVKYLLSEQWPSHVEYCLEQERE